MDGGSTGPGAPARFCGACGTPSADTAARFCGSCGAPAPVGPPPAGPASVPQPSVAPPVGPAPFTASPAVAPLTGPATPAPAARRRLERKRSLVLVAVATVTAMVAGAAWWTARPDDADERAGGRDDEAVERTTTSTARRDLPAGAVDEAGGVVELDGGVRITVPAGAVQGVGTFTAEPIDHVVDAADLADSPWVAVGEGAWDIDLDGAELVGEITVELPVPATALHSDAPDDLPSGTPSPTAADHLMVLHARDDGTVVEALPVSVDAEAGTIAFRTDELSWWDPIRLGWNKLVEWIRPVLSALTSGVITSATPPTCSPASVDGDAGWRYTPEPADDTAPVRWCAEQRADGGRLLRIVNLQSYALWMRWDQPALSVTGSTSGLGAQLSDLLAGAQGTVLGAGDRVDVVVPADAGVATITATYDGLAQAVQSLVVATEIIAAVAGKLPVRGSARTAGQILAGLDLATCFEKIGIDPLSQLSSLPSTAALVVTVLTSCFDGPALRSMFRGIVGVVLAGAASLVVSVVGYLWSSGDAFADLVSGGGTFRLVVTPGDGTPTPVTPGPGGTGGTGGTGSGWPTDDDDGPPVLWAWFGANFTFPDWVSCSPTTCIAGVDGTVQVIVLDGLDVVAVLDEAADPATALAGAGFSPADIAVLLDPS